MHTQYIQAKSTIADVPVNIFLTKQANVNTWFQREKSFSWAEIHQTFDLTLLFIDGNVIKSYIHGILSFFSQFRSSPCELLQTKHDEIDKNRRLECRDFRIGFPLIWHFIRQEIVWKTHRIQWCDTHKTFRVFCLITAWLHKRQIKALLLSHSYWRLLLLLYRLSLNRIKSHHAYDRTPSIA